MVCALSGSINKYKEKCQARFNLPLLPRFPVCRLGKCGSGRKSAEQCHTTPRTVQRILKDPWEMFEHGIKCHENSQSTELSQDLVKCIASQGRYRNIHNL